MSLRLVAGTIIAKNYLAYARVWAKSMRKHHPEARIVVLLSDRNDGAIDPVAEPFDLLEAESLGIPAFDSMAFRYDVMELSTAVKPAFLEWLLASGDEDVALYFDPDILVLAPVIPVLEALERSNIVLTPHALSPIPVDGRRPSDAAFLVSGTYNLGFVGVRKSQETDRMLSWWKARLVRGGASAPEKGLFTDQKWVDLVPAFFEGVEILRDPSLNVAYWNLHERGSISRPKGVYSFHDEPIRFFHFSGFVPDRPELVSKHQDRFRVEDLTEAARELFAAYTASIASEGHEEARRLPYAYGTFEDGEALPLYMRAAYRQAEADGRSWPNPFAAGAGSFREWALGPGNGKIGAPPLVRAVWEGRPDVRSVFPQGLGDQAASLIRWILGPGGAGLGIGPAVRDGLEGALAPMERERSPLGATRGTVRAVSARPQSLRTLLMEDPALLPEERGPYEAPPGSALMRFAERILGKSVYRRLRFRRWCYLYQPIRATIPLQVRDGATEAPVERARETVITPVEAPFGVNLFGYLDTESGIAEVARCFVRMLEAEGVPVAAVTISQDWLRRQDRSMTNVADSTPFPVNVFFVNADQLPAVLSSRRALLDGRQTVGYWFWELEAFPERFDGAFGFVDEVWVASSFCQRAIAERSPVPVVRIPPSISTSGWPRPDRARFGFTEQDLVFLYVFDSASMVRRKNPGGVVSAFRRAFPSPGREVLVVKTTHASPRDVRALERLARGSRVRVLTGYQDRDDLLALLGSVDGYVSLHRSEGLGLTLLESMAYARPVVATAYGGCEDFLRPGSAFLVPYRRAKLRRAAGPYPADAVWAEPDLEAAATALQVLSRDAGAAADVGRRGEEVFREWGTGGGALARARLRMLGSRGGHEF